MIFTLIDKNLTKHTSFDVSNEIKSLSKRKQKEILSKVFENAISVLKGAGISEKDILIIDWDQRRFFLLKDFKVEDIFK